MTERMSSVTCPHLVMVNVKATKVRDTILALSTHLCHKCFSEKERKQKHKLQLKHASNSDNDIDNRRKTLWICLTCVTLSCGDQVVISDTPCCPAAGCAFFHSTPRHPLALSLSLHPQAPITLVCFQCRFALVLKDSKGLGTWTEWKDGTKQQQELYEAFLDIINAYHRYLVKIGPIIEGVVPSTRIIAMPPPIVWAPKDISPSSPPGHESPSPQQSDQVSIPCKGLKNIGNTCFFNSILQALACLPDFQANLCQYPGLPLAVHLEKVLKDLRSVTFPLQISLKSDNSSVDDTLKSFLPPLPNSHSTKIKPGKAMVKNKSDCSYGGTVDPSMLHASLCLLFSQFKGYRQHDSHELLRCMISALDDVASKTSSSHSTASALASIFAGKLKSCFRCLSCESVVSVNEPFMDLSLPIIASPTEIDGSIAVLENEMATKLMLDNNGSSRSAGKTSVMDCLYSFLSPEKLSDEDQFNCKNCFLAQNKITGDATTVEDSSSTNSKSVKFEFMKRDAFRWYEIGQFPRCLVLHLKRFAHASSNVSKNTKALRMADKIQGHVFFPLILNFNGQYELVAVVQHSGSMRGGHYIAFVRTEGPQWWCCSDSLVKPVTADEVLSSQAYLLFYYRTQK